MVSQLVNEVACIIHVWGRYEQNSIVKNVGVDDWTAKLAIIASNDQWFFFVAGACCCSKSRNFWCEQIVNFLSFSNWMTEYVAPIKYFKWGKKPLGFEPLKYRQQT